MIAMDAWSTQSVQLSHEQAAQLAALSLVDVFAGPATDTWKLVSNSRIGIASGPGWELRVSPKLAVPKLFFLLAYALDPNGWKDESADFSREPDLMEPQLRADSPGTRCARSSRVSCAATCMSKSR